MTAEEKTLFEVKIPAGSSPYMPAERFFIRSKDRFDALGLARDLYESHKTDDFRSEVRNYLNDAKIEI